MCKIEMLEYECNYITDIIIDELLDGENVHISTRAGVGKINLGLIIALKLASQGIKSELFSNELSMEDINVIMSNLGVTKDDNRLKNITYNCDECKSAYDIQNYIDCYIKLSDNITMIVNLNLKQLDSFSLYDGVISTRTTSYGFTKEMVSTIINNFIIHC